MRPWGLILTGAIALLGMVGELRSPINGDVAWLLHAADRMLDGERLYVDLLETNPPLAVWLDLPVVAAARLTGVPADLLYRLAVLVLALGSTAACALLLGRALPSPGDPARTTVPLAIALTLLVLPAPFFGQREHLALALVLPYLVAGATAGASRLGRGGEVVVGLAAAIGLALKPPFLAVWAGVVGYRLLRGGEFRPSVRPMDVAIAGGLAAYAVAVIALTPEFFSLAALLGGPFLEYSRRPVLDILTRNVFPLAALLSLVLYLVARGVVRHKALGDHLAIAAAGFLLAVVVQGKGYGYHYLPALGSSVILLAVMLSGAAEPRRALLRAAAVVCATLLLFGASAPLVEATIRRARGTRSAIDREMLQTAEFVRARAGGSQVAVLSTRLADAFPMVVYAGANWSLRFPNLWFVQVYGRRPPAAELPGAAAWSVRTVSEDLARRRPALILVRSPDAPGDLDAGLDYIAFLGRDPSFRRELAAYRMTGRQGPYLVYERSPGP